MDYEHLKLKLLTSEFNYVLFDGEPEFFKFVQLIKSHISESPVVLFCSAAEMSAIVPSNLTAPSKKIESGWIGLRIVGEMPFGTVQGLIAQISGVLRDAGLGTCVVSTFLTDLFFIKKVNKDVALRCLVSAGWEVIDDNC